MVCSWSCFLLFVFVVFFFFKQKTAYEMRISDWSSDVCSSDLPARVSAIELLCMSASTSDSRSSRRQEAWRAITLSRHPSFSFIDRLRARVGASVRRYSGCVFACAWKIGRASCRERVCQYVSISVVAVSLKKKTQAIHTEY